MRRIFTAWAIGWGIVCGGVTLSCQDNRPTTSRQCINYIDTRVGTAPSVTHTAGLFGKHTEEYGQTLPAVLEPNGMNFWTPQTRDTEHKCVAPYYYVDSLLQGFRNAHWIVGGCTQDYGSMTLMPLFGTLRCQPEDRATRFAHDDEQATPAYYRVMLPDEGISAEMTARSRSAIFRFTYTAGGKGYLVVNPNSDEGEGYIRIDTLHHRIYGYNPVHRIYQGWGKPAGFSGHFMVTMQKKWSDYGVFNEDSVMPLTTAIGQRPRIGAYVAFDVSEGEEVLLKAVSSFTDQEGAEKNLQIEIPHWNFDKTRGELTDIWEKQLATVEVESDDTEALQKFYGALYRASFLPRTFNDVDGRYPAFASNLSGKAEWPADSTLVCQLPSGHTYYEDYSMWDTYRALHPLLNLLFPNKAGDMMQSLVKKYEQGGWLPIFPCWNSYTAAMIGDHAIAALSDAYCKGIRFDIEKAYKAMRQNAFETPADIEAYRNGMGRRALDSYLQYGYIPLEDEVRDAFHKREQVSRTLEYAYDDFALAQVADALGYDNDYMLLKQRAENYRHVIDRRTGYAQGRYADGRFMTEDNAFTFASFITEGAPCHYTWYVPHDPYGLMECMGGRNAFVAKLDSMFSERRYWHGNEPCHQVPFLFNYAGEPWKTQRAVRYIMDTEYLNAPGGLSGNDDAGQMSAWYVFAAMGFYPVCPATPYYLLASPSFPSVTLHLENGKQFKMVARKASPTHIYIQSATLNGKPYTRNFITHQMIMEGGTMEFVMGETPNREWGSKGEDCVPQLMP